MRFADADAFGFVQRAADAGGVHELDRNAADGDGFADQIAGGAGRGGDDGALALDQAVEQARFADVGAADDGERQAFVDDLAVGEGRGELLRAERGRRRCVRESARREARKRRLRRSQFRLRGRAISSTSFCLMGCRRRESAPSSCCAATLAW